MRKYKYNINNLDCAGCALNLEENLNKNKDLENVSVNFTTSKISYETDTVTIDELNKLVKKIEPDVTITDSVENNKEYHISILVIGLLLAVSTLFIKVDILNKILIFLSYILLLYKPFSSAYKMLKSSHSINENALITISSIGAYLVGNVMEGIMVVSLYLIGKILEEKAINNSRKSISDLVSIRQDYANKITDDGIITIDVEDIKVKDKLLIKKGEKIPVDGIVIEGSTKLDTKALTGESELTSVNINDNVISGSINTGEVITIRATHKYIDSTVYKILELVTNASDAKAHTETFVSKMSKIYTPMVLLLALFGVSLSDSIYRGLTFLVISCPCAIAISVPLSYFTGIGVSSKNGILIKGSNYLDNLSHIKKIIFDKD